MHKKFDGINQIEWTKMIDSNLGRLLGCQENEEISATLSHLCSKFGKNKCYPNYGMMVLIGDKTRMVWEMIKKKTLKINQVFYQLKCIQSGLLNRWKIILGM